MTTDRTTAKRLLDIARDIWPFVVMTAVPLVILGFVVAAQVSEENTKRDAVSALNTVAARDYGAVVVDYGDVPSGYGSWGGIIIQSDGAHRACVAALDPTGSVLLDCEG